MESAPFTKIEQLPAPASKDIHVIIADLTIDPELQEQLFMRLSDDEQKRAGRFKLDKHRRRFIAAHGYLRHLLAAHLETAPAGLLYHYGKTGKPVIAKDQNPDNLCFNLSHSHELAVFALALNTPVGIDIEHVRKNFDPLGLAKRYFSNNEFNQISTLPKKQQTAAFYHAWTRKEAVLKVSGQGITRIETVEVTILDNEPLRIISPEKRAGTCSLYSFTVPDGYTAALAAEGHNHSLVTFHI